jgi:transposase InsO family protein
VIIGFLKDIIVRFGCPNKNITDNVASFRSEPLIKFFEHFGIALIHSTPYYLQGNGLVEPSNKILINIIKRLLEENKKSWDSKLKFALWADRVTTKRSLGLSPFQQKSSWHLTVSKPSPMEPNVITFICKWGVFL